MSQREYNQLVEVLEAKKREAIANPQVVREQLIKLKILTPKGRPGKHYKELCIAFGLATS